MQREELKKEVIAHFEAESKNTCKNIDLICDWIDKHKTDKTHNNQIVFNYMGHECSLVYELTSSTILIVPNSNLVDIGKGVGVPVHINLDDKPKIIIP